MEIAGEIERIADAPDVARLEARSPDERKGAV
jgi:hypothetical protein